MLRAERRAADGHLMAVSAQPLADYDGMGLEPEPETPARWFNAAIPVLVVVGVTLWGLWWTGTQTLIAQDVVDPRLSDVIGAADPFSSLLWASLLGVMVAVGLAVVQRLLTVRHALDAVIGGFRSMLVAAVVLTLAWSLGQVCKDLATADFLKSAIGPNVAPGLLPMAVFVVAAAVSFATGTSWGTMAILTPLAIPLVVHAGDGETSLIAATVAAILGGAVFGDHCSPISDTTIMSSMASSCDHVDHVRTQLPYALMAAAIAIVCGYLPTGMFDVPELVCVAGGLAAVVLVFRALGRPVLPVA
jgi:Na+/H+ antiporter NhaC